MSIYTYNTVVSAAMVAVDDLIVRIEEGIGAAGNAEVAADTHGSIGALERGGVVLEGAGGILS